VIQGLQKVSKPGRRVYLRKHELPRVQGGMGRPSCRRRRDSHRQGSARGGLGGEYLCASGRSRHAVSNWKASDRDSVRVQVAREGTSIRVKGRRASCRWRSATASSAGRAEGDRGHAGERRQAGPGDARHHRALSPTWSRASRRASPRRSRSWARDTAPRWPGRSSRCRSLLAPDRVRAAGRDLHHGGGPDKMIVSGASKELVGQVRPTSRVPVAGAYKGKGYATRANTSAGRPARPRAARRRVRAHGARERTMKTQAKPRLEGASGGTSASGGR